MKKFIAILLSCIMLFACVSVSVSAADWTETAVISVAQTVSDTVYIKGTYTVTAALTVPENASIVIERGGSLIITSSTGRLINNGSITVKNGGVLNISGTGADLANAAFVNNATGVLTIENGAACDLSKTANAYNYGTINNIDRMDIKGNLSHQVTLPGGFTVDYPYTVTWNRQNINVEFGVGYYLYDVGDSDLDYTETSSYTAITTESNILVPHGQKLFILISPEDGDGDWVDVGRMKLTVGGQSLSAQEKVDNDRGVFCIVPSNALKVGVYSTEYKDLVKVFEITLPSTEGYYVISKDGDVDVANVEFGKTFSFRVVLSPDYDKSDYYAYVNAFYLDHDEYGYYDVTGPITDDGMSTEGGVQGDIEIQIMGIQANERLEMVNSLVGFIQQIFEVIKEIFSYFTGIFDGLGNLGENV